MTNVNGMGRVRKPERRLRRLALAAALLASAAPAIAQEEPETGDAPPPAAASPATVEGAKTYSPADFARFAPKTALDMLRQVPGFIIREATQERGLGQATGNVLLNSQRISGKSNDVITELSRIPAQNVIRIDILDGATLDIPGLSGQVANIVAKAGTMSGQFAWRPEFRSHVTDPLLTRFETSVSGIEGPVEYTLGVENQSFRSGAGGITQIFGPDGTFRQVYDDVWTGSGEVPKLSGRFVVDGPGSSVGNLNLSYQEFLYDYREQGERSGPGLADRDRIVEVDEDSYSYEMGGDYEFALGGGRLKVIGLNRFERIPYGEFVRIDYADLTDPFGERFLRTGDSKERIARAEYRWKSGAADWQVSAEGAFNSLDNVSELFAMNADGSFTPVELENGTARVEEDRYEVMGSYGRPLAPNLSIQVAAGGEYSNLRQVGAGGLTRTFWRPKGQVSAAWKPSPRTDVNVKLQRKVGQLNFYDFLATVNLNDDRENAGNPDLVPQQSWELDVETIRNLGAWGTTTLRLYGRLYDDIVDIIPIGETGESPGNIDRATSYGAEWKSTFHLEALGWKGAKLDTRAQIQKTSLEDPLTGEKRRISNSLMHLLSASLRHDVPDTDWAWGGDISYELAALNYRLTEVGRLSEGPVWASLFVEHKDVYGLTVRATAGNLLGADSMWDRTVFVGRRTGPVDFTQRRDREIGQIFSFSVRGKF